jgi:hypothetical protein
MRYTEAKLRLYLRRVREPGRLVLVHGLQRPEELAGHVGFLRYSNQVVHQEENRSAVHTSQPRPPQPQD